MNYIKEINAFYDRMETQPLSGSAISLWHALMQINNKARWVNSFTVPMVILMGKCGFAERTIRAARQELKEKGYIHFVTQKGNSAAIYHMLELSGEIVNTSHVQDDRVEEIITERKQNHVKVYAGSHADNDNHDDAENNAGSNATLYKQNMTKQEKTLFHTFVMNFKREPTPFQIQTLETFIDQDGLEERLVCHAMSLSGERRKPFNYAVAILNQWVGKRVFTLEDAKREEEKFYAEKKSEKGGHSYEQYDPGLAASSSIPANFKFYQ